MLPEGPSTPDAFAKWAGISARAATAAFDALRGSLTLVRTPLGGSWILTDDEQAFRAAPGRVAPARLLPSGDAYFLVWGADRELSSTTPIIAASSGRPASGQAPSSLRGEIVGTWRRTQHTVRVRAWHRLSAAARDAVGAEAASIPLPGVDRQIVVRWEDD